LWIGCGRHDVCLLEQFRQLADLFGAELRHAREHVGTNERVVRLVRGNAEVARAEGREVYAQREVRLLNRLAAFMRRASPERVRAIEMLVEELLAKHDVAS